VPGPAASAVGPEGAAPDVFHSIDLEVFVRRGNWFVVIAVMAASLAVGAGMALATSTKAGSKTSGKAKVKPKVVTLHCSVSLTTEPPSDSNAVPAPVQQGTMYGPTHCSGKHVGGGGVESAPFTIPDSGDTVGNYVQYFDAGTIKGKFNWSPQEGAPVDSTTFQSQTWTGTVTVDGGTGVFKGIKGKSSTGVMNCSSPDNVHFTCTEKIRVKMPISAAAAQS
jgi:hypothetical protein